MANDALKAAAQKELLRRQAKAELARREAAKAQQPEQAITTLEQHGFIVTTRKSSFTLKHKLAAEYRLTAFKCNVTGAVPSKDFASWAGKIQNTVAPMKPHGFTHETVSEKRRRKQTEQFHPCNREGTFGAGHSFTHEPLLYSSHRVEATTPTLNARQGAATQRASAPASTNSTTDPLDAWTDIHGAALKSLEELSDRLAPDVQSWAARNLVPSQPAIPARAAA
jgi:hypothetical protein